MLKNRKLLSKAEQIEKMIAMPTIVLTAEEADRFIDYMVDQSILKKNARVVRMAKPTKNIRAMGFGDTRFLKPSATFSSSDYKKEWTQGKIELVSKKLRGAVAIFDDDLEDNIEQAAFKTHIMQLVALKIANELEEIAWISDTHSLGGFAASDARSLFDGWRYIITHSQAAETYYNDVTGAANILTAGAGGSFVLTGTKIAEQNASAPFNWEFKYSKMLKTMPSVYKAQGLGKLRFWHSDLVTQDYVDALAARSTILGDNAILGQNPLQYGKVPLVDCPLMPVTLNAAGKLGAGSFTDTLLTPAENLIVGIQRDITIESQREAADEATYWFYSLRVDFKVENVNAVVLTKGMTTA
jgi:hypothetical protein